MLSLLLLLAGAPEPKRITLDVREAEIQNVLRLFADVAQLNIVVSDEVKGRVTVRLKNVPWPQALDVVLQSKGLGKEASGEVIHIDLAERIAARRASAAARAKAEEELAPLITVMIPLSHADAANMVPIVAPLLTPRGNVTFDRRTNVLIVTDVADAIARVRSTI